MYIRINCITPSQYICIFVLSLSESTVVLVLFQIQSFCLMKCSFYFEPLMNFSSSWIFKAHQISCTWVKMSITITSHINSWLCRLAVYRDKPWITWTNNNSNNSWQHWLKMCSGLLPSTLHPYKLHSSLLLLSILYLCMWFPPSWQDVMAPPVIHTLSPFCHTQYSTIPVTHTHNHFTLTPHLGHTHCSALPVAVTHTHSRLRLKTFFGFRFVNYRISALYTK